MKKENKHINSLADFPKAHPFKVPENYFENFEERLQQKIQQQEKPKGRLIQIVRPILWLAASFLLAFLLIRYPLSMLLPDYNSDVSSTEVEYEISMQSLDDDEFYSIITDELHAELIKTEEILDFLTVELSDYEIYSEMYN